MSREAGMTEFRLFLYKRSRCCTYTCILRFSTKYENDYNYLLLIQPKQPTPALTEHMNTGQ